MLESSWLNLLFQHSVEKLQVAVGFLSECLVTNNHFTRWNEWNVNSSALSEFVKEIMKAAARRVGQYLVLRLM